MASRLADIYKSEIGRGGGLGSTIGKRIGEKIDPRQMFDQSGLLTAMFPSLKAYNATAKRPGTKKSETNSSGNMSSASMGAILASSNLTAKNTMVLPAMARDMNLMRQNIAKMVKLQGGKPSMKGDMFFKRAGERNTLFESTLGKMGGVTAKGGKGLNLFGTSTEKDGQTPESALYVKSAGGEEGGDLNIMSGKGGVLKSLASIAGSIISSPTFIAAAAIGGTALLARFMKSRNDEELKKPENANVPRNVTNAAQNQSTAIATGNLTKGTANDIVKRLTEDKLKGAAADSFCNDVVRGTNLAKVLEVCDDGLKQKYLEMVAKDTTPSQTVEPSTPPPGPVPSTSVPDTTNDARRGRGYIPSEPTIPSNAVVSGGTGGTISTGSGGMVVSPSYETAPAPASMPRPTPAPTAPAATVSTTPTPATTRPVTSNPSEGESAVRAAAAKYGITDPTELNALLAQVSHESGDYKYLTELGGRKYFDKYEGRKDLGNTQPGDGYKYRGRGYIQLTGRDNYTEFSKFSGIDAVNNPDIVSTPSVGAEAALWFWQKKVKPKVKDFNNVKAVTQVVNGGQNGIADRTQKFQTLMASSTPSTTPSESSPSTALAAAPSSSIPAGTQIASASSEVTAARYSGRAQMRQQPAAPVVVNAGGSGDTKILTTQKSTPYNGEFYASLVSSKAL
jgi:putative chitinase